MGAAQPDLSSYPGMEHMPCILGKRLYSIQGDGRLQSVPNINQRFGDELDRFHFVFRQRPDPFLLGSLLPPQHETRWNRSASLVFTETVYHRLSSLEEMLLRMIPEPLLHTHTLTREMSVYAGMRRLNMYGLLLGYHPVIVLREDGMPVAANLRSTSFDASEASFHRHLKALSLSSLFSTGLPERDFVNGVFRLYDAVGAC